MFFTNADTKFNKYWNYAGHKLWFYVCTALHVWIIPLALFRFYYNIRFIFILYFFAQLIKNEEIDIKKVLYHLYVIGCVQFF